MDPTATLFAPSSEEIEARYGPCLAELGAEAGAWRYQIAPNPCVGAALFTSEGEIARGFHQRWGGSHAEVRALEAAAASGVPKERWDTLVVTLEPCRSHGKTPPCTEAVLASGVRRVVVGAFDPDPRHRGRGLETLHRAGLEVVVLPAIAPLDEVAPHFLRWTAADRLRRGLPWTIAKWAQTRTGQLSPPAEVGEGRWISGPDALAEVQLLRGRVDAIVTGVGTVRADDPRLTVRSPGELGKPPLRVILDSGLRTPLDARVLRTEGFAAEEAGGPVLVLSHPGAQPARHRALRRAGVEVQAVRPGDGGRLSLYGVQQLLWQRGVRRVLLEAGPTLVEAYFESEMVDQVSVYTGEVSGGRGASLAPYLLPERFDQRSHRELGGDSVLEAFCR